MGQSILTSLIFIRSFDKPTKPKGGTFISPVANGWSDGIPPIDNGKPVWVSMRVFTSDGKSPQEAEWSDPEIMVDTAEVDFEYSSSNVDNPGTPSIPLNNAVWTNDSDENTIWIAIQRTVNGFKLPWKVYKGKGEQGVPAASVVTSHVFIRSHDRPPTPIGGSFNDLVPNGWSDGIPGPLDGMPVWMSSRIFTEDGKYPQGEWSIPQLQGDTQTMDMEWSETDTDDPGTPDEP